MSGSIFARLRPAINTGIPRVFGSFPNSRGFVRKVSLIDREVQRVLTQAFPDNKFIARSLTIEAKDMDQFALFDILLRQNTRPVDHIGKTVHTIFNLTDPLRVNGDASIRTIELIRSNGTTEGRRLDRISSISYDRITISPETRPTDLFFYFEALKTTNSVSTAHGILRLITDNEHTGHTFEVTTPRLNGFKIRLGSY